MNKRLLMALACVFTLFVTSCTRNAPAVYRGFPKEYNSAWLEIYGRCYDSVPYAVVALDLYSEGLELDTNHQMQGTGYNLYISDIFVPDSLLEAGTYTSLSNENGFMEPKPFTFLPGRNWEGTPSGMYLLYVEDGKMSSIQVLDSGSFIVSDVANGLTDLQFTIHYKNSYGYKATYPTHFQGPLFPWEKR